MPKNMPDTMPETDELIYSSKELFSKFLKGRQFNIPGYQRGYKWTPDNVATLLNDLNHFNPTENDFYCLQNITVTDGDDNKLNVIDGQQRLTTIFLFLSFFGELGKALPSAECLLYSVRESTHIFLQQEVATGKIWTAEINPEEARSKDQHYIANACKAIKKWFDEHEAEKETMHGKILDNLKVIVNRVESGEEEVDSGEEEIVFSGLNGGKVNLDGADLLRAILITRAARQKYPDTDGNLEKIGSFRAKLGLELDDAAQWWGQDDVKSYFTQLLPDGLSKNSQFGASKYPIDLLYYAFYEAYREHFSDSVKSEDLDVRLFENGVDFNNKQGDDHLEFYEKVSEFNLTMQDWFGDDEIFNLTGYLMFNFKRVLSFSDLWTIWDNAVSKSDFVRELKKLVRKSMALAYEPSEKKRDEVTEEEIAESFGRLINFIQQKDADWYHHPMISPVLALADILPVEYKDKKGHTSEKLQRADILDFRHRSSEEDKEHIRSQKRELYKKTKIEDMTPEQMQELKEENEKGLNSLGNMVLLDFGINRSYHNDSIDLKMERILGEAALGEIHIRPYTQSVFRQKLKNLDNNGILNKELFWSDEDVVRTYTSLAQRIQNYLNV